MKDKKSKWENEMWNTTTPPDDIRCKTCKFKLEDVMIEGKIFKRHTFGNCKIYSSPELKPHEVLWDNEPCEFYEKEDSKK